MDRAKKPFLQVPENVVSDTFEYRAKVQRYLRGETSAVAFKAQRVPMGIYGQRAAEKYMVRIRIGAGLVSPYQLYTIAELSTSYGNGIVHITTRQDIQLHEINIEDTPDILESLLEAGLSPRGGGGNTVRNITACPRSGVCPKENFSVAPYAIAAAEYLLQHKSSYNMPRKYKIVFSGCPKDCAFASTADLGFFAHIKDGTQGFAAYAGGGLGPSPKTGILIEEFVTTNKIFLVAEALKRLFDDYGDRSNKHRARLRYVLHRVGEQEFIQLYKNYKKQLIEEGLPGNIPEPRQINFIPRTTNTTPAAETKEENLETADIESEKYPGYYTLRIPLKLGDIAADDLVEVGRAADEFAQGIVRTTQLQDLLITSIPKENLQSAIKALQKRGFAFTSDDLEIINCTGAATCKLGLCLSRGLSRAICKELQGTKVSTEHKNKVIRISGCPNSCANHYIADLGFEGKARRINGRLIPYYEVLAGSKIYEGKTRLAGKVGSLPAKKVPGFVEEYLSNGNRTTSQLTELISRHSKLPEDIPEDFYRDFGKKEPFSLAGRGPGECGAGVLDVIRVDIRQAKDALKNAQQEQNAKQKSDSVYEAILAAARSLLIIYGLEPKKDRQIFEAFDKHLIKQGWVNIESKDLIDQAMDWRLGDTETLTHLIPRTEGLIARLQELFLSLDANLKFRAEPFSTNKENEQSVKTNQNRQVDLRGVACPLNFVKAKLEIEKIKVGEVLEILVDEGEPVENVPASFQEQGQEILEVKKLNGHCLIKVKRKNQEL